MKEILTFMEEIHFEELTDLRYRRELPQEEGIYILYGENDSVLYIGETKNLRDRVRKHILGADGSKKFYKDIVAVKYAHTGFDRFTREVAEGLLLLKYRPIHNCTDLDLATSKGMTEELIHDVIFYAREHKLKADYVAEKLGVALATVNSYGAGILGKTIQLPKGYKPIVLLDLSKQRRGQKESALVTEEMFHEITALLKNGLTMIKIGEMFGVSITTVSYIKNLKLKKYRQWSKGEMPTV